MEIRLKKYLNTGLKKYINLTNMKGVTFKTFKGWMVKYMEQLPPDQITNKFYPSELLLPIHLGDVQHCEHGKQIDFKEDYVFIKTGQCMGGEVEGYNLKVARLILPVKTIENEWDNIFDSYMKNKVNLNFNEFKHFLIKTYNPPLPIYKSPITDEYPVEAEF